MFEIVRKKTLAESIYLMSIHAPRIAVGRKTGQFVIVRPHERSERIPLTVADADPQALSITIVFQAVGKTTRELAAMEPGQQIADVVGPLGQPTEIGNYDHCVCIGGGVGIALIWPIAKALRKTSKRLTGIISARRADLLILEDELRDICDELITVFPRSCCGRCWRGRDV